MTGVQLALPLDAALGDELDASDEKTTTTTKQRSTIAPHTPDAKIDSSFQPTLEGMGVQGRAVRQRQRQPLWLVPDSDSASLIEEFRQLVLRRASPKTAKHYRWVMKDVLRIAARLAGHHVGICELYGDQGLLCAVFSCPTTSTGDQDVSMWLTSHRRTVPTQFADLMARALRKRGVLNASDRVTQALRAVAAPTGTGYSLLVGRPRGRGGPMPTPEEAAIVLRELAAVPGWQGHRDFSIASILRRRGQRINALLDLDGSNLYRMPDGRLRLMVRAKSSKQPAEVELPVEIAMSMSAYADDFNAWARRHGSAVRIGIGVPGLFWRQENMDRLSYAVWTKRLKQAAIRAGVTPFSSHALRRAFATEATQVLPRSVAALAGGWASNRKMDDHYVQPSHVKLRKRLANLSGNNQAERLVETSSGHIEVMNGEAAQAV